MTSAEVLRFCKKTGPKVQKDLGIQRFTIDYRCVPLEDDTSGFTTQARVRLLGHYEEAIISIIPDAIVDEKDLYRVLRHELLHILLAPIDQAFSVLGQLVTKANHEAANVLIHQGLEGAVKALEKTYLAK